MSFTQKEKSKKSSSSSKHHKNPSPNKSLLNNSTKSALNSSRFMQYSQYEMKQADITLKNTRKKTYPSRSPERNLFDLINNRTSETGYDSRLIRHPSPSRLLESVASRNRVMTLEQREIDTPKFNGKKTFFDSQTNYDPVMGLYRSNSSFGTAEKRRRESFSTNEDHNQVTNERGINYPNAISNRTNLSRNLFGESSDFRRIHVSDFEKPVRRSSQLDRSFDSAKNIGFNKSQTFEKNSNDVPYKNSSLSRSKMLLGLLPQGYASTK
jgi:hypothetical protein